MLKTILIIVLVCYVLYKAGSFMYNIVHWVFSGSSHDPQNDMHNNHMHRPKTGRNKQDGNYQGGEYIDYEEVN